MGREAVKERRRRRKREEIEEVGFWPGLCNRINEGLLIPIISDTVYNDLLFDINSNGILGLSSSQSADDVLQYNIREQLAKSYAYWSDFPLSEDHRLARVSLFNSVTNKTDKLAAKKEYLHWLKGELLFQAEEDADVDDLLVEELQDELDKPFTYIVKQLNYPKLAKGQNDPLDTLAKLQLSIYITTSPFEFMEQALLTNGVTPRTQICFWNGAPQAYRDEAHEIEQHPAPSRENPIVYHLFGHESYPESLVLTEDDYLDFLVKLSIGFGQKQPILPHYLRKRLALSSLVLLGYRPGDWDFRIMFRGLLAPSSSVERFNLAIQFDPAQRPNATSTDEIKEYLKRYFNPIFDVEWDTTHAFVAKLYEMWDKQRR
ncbi:MAG: SIR2 family protein [Chloroflexota bacterium]